VQEDQRPRILVVEDESLIALDLAELVMGLGCEVIGPAGSLRESRGLARRRRIDGAILDIRLRDGGEVYPLAEELLGAGIPIVFATALDHSIPAEYVHVPTIAKPFSREILRALVEQVLLKRI